MLVHHFKWVEDFSKSDESFIKSYHKESDVGYFFEGDIQYLENLCKTQNKLSFLPERMKIEKVKKLAANLHNKTEYVVHIRNLKQALNHGLVLKKLHRVFKFNQKSWLKPYIDLNTNLRKAAKNNFEKDFSKLTNNSVFGKIMANVRKHRDITLARTDKRKNYLVPEPNYHTAKCFTENLFAIKMIKTQILLNKPVYLGLSILDLSKTVMYGFWYDCEEKKNMEKR